MDRFLLAKNENKRGESSSFILQTVEHDMLIEIVPYELEQDLDYYLDDVFDFYEHQGQKYMFIVRRFFYLYEEEIDDHIKEIRAQINKAWKWYKSILIKRHNEKKQTRRT